MPKKYTLLFTSFLLLGSMQVYVKAATLIDDVSAQKSELVCKIGDTKEQLMPCVDQHVHSAIKLISGTGLKERAEITAGIFSALGTGMLNDISYALSSISDTRGITSDKAHDQLALLGGRAKKTSVMTGEGTLSTVGTLAPYIALAGASFVTTAVLMASAEAIIAGGISSLVVGGAYKWTKYQSNKNVCKKMCTADEAQAPLLAKLMAEYFKYVVSTLNTEQIQEKKIFQAFREHLGRDEKELLGDPYAQEKAGFIDVGSIITRFSESVSPVITAYVQSGAHCLLNCPSDSLERSVFTCEVIDQLGDDVDMHTLLYLAQVLSVSHNNFVSLDGVKNSNLAKFLRQTRSSKAGNFNSKLKRMGRHDPEKYGASGENKCVEWISARGQRDQRAISGKIQALIIYQSNLENKAKLMEESILNQPYETATPCSDCNQDVQSQELTKLDEKCRAHIEKLVKNTDNARARALKALNEAVHASKFKRKQGAYLRCIKA